jgi:hypothetical protein
MSRWHSIVAVCVVGLFVAWLGFFLNRPARRAPAPEINFENALPSPGKTSASVLTKPGGSERQISLQGRTMEQAMQEWWHRRERDKQADWRVTISFYGKVVDQDMRPIAAANVKFQWTDLSQNGTSNADTLSDENGYFSLVGAQGKNLGVYVSKEEYYTPKATKAAAFEFGNPGESNYYEPDAQKPVLFTLRKKGQGAQLIKKSIEVVLPGDGSGENVDLAAGKVSMNGQLEVRAWKPWPPRPMSPRYDWKVSFTIADGGFVEAPEEFAVEAPETVYNPSLEFNMPSSAGDVWKVTVERRLYFTYGQPKKYGRLDFRTDGNSRYIFINYVLNPSGSRNLEEASNDTVKNGN